MRRLVIAWQFRSCPRLLSQPTPVAAMVAAVIWVDTWAVTGRVTWVDRRWVRA